MELPHNLECGARLGLEGRCRVPGDGEQLVSLFEARLAAAERNVDLVDAVGMQDAKRFTCGVDASPPWAMAELYN